MTKYHKSKSTKGSLSSLADIEAFIEQCEMQLARYPLHLLSLTDNRRLDTLTLALLVSPEMVFSLKQLPTNLAFPALRQDVQTLDVKNSDRPTYPS